MVTQGLAHILTLGKTFGRRGSFGRCGSSAHLDGAAHLDIQIGVYYYSLWRRAGHLRSRPGSPTSSTSSSAEETAHPSDDQEPSDRQDTSVLDMPGREYRPRADRGDERGHVRKASDALRTGSVMVADLWSVELAHILWLAHSVP